MLIFDLNCEREGENGYGGDRMSGELSQIMGAKCSFFSQIMGLNKSFFFFARESEIHAFFSLDREKGYLINKV